MTVTCCVLTFHCRMVIDWRCQLVGYPGEVLTDMDYSIYPQGFYTVRLQDFSHTLSLSMLPWCMLTSVQSAVGNPIATNRLSS